MIPVKYASYVFSFFMSLLMSGIMSLAISIINLGWVDNMLSIWLRAWSMAFIIAFPTIIAVTPVVRKLVSLVLARQPANS
ncbi:DUF2798 domain-containing protein [Bowmanella dokdonensis]|uniref:DUF2798 domain-containing protein n=1 Tax=Bowmanella dokdonensis TaxID=751969 RepID=A0A939DS25_9ALTE|nr:DUF2798 domain-containing protein [Bowmanella dokdonensis]MBN7827709.1 DUF2798 domain-containing protein [Bowmanella dokdonensis]